MSRVPSRLLLLGALGLAVGVGCALLPERYALNVPVANLLWGGGIDAPSDAVIRQRLQVPQGFSVGLWADEVPNARMLRFTETGDLLVSQPRRGQVTLLERDADGDGRPDGRRVLLTDLDRPHGLALRGGWLYVAETGAVGRIRFDAATRTASGAFERIVPGLPAGGNHWTRTIGIGPDGALYVSLGSSCNVCVEDDPRRAAIVRYRLDGGGEEVVATGLRNAVGFDWHPDTQALWATDNGRDLLGDDFPPCELNEVRAGGFYGWPYANGDRVPDPDYGTGEAARVAASVPPAHDFRAHNAPLGMTFLRGSEVPAAYHHAALVALHGSWNRTRKDGYKVVSLHWQDDGRIDERDFLWGFLVDESVIGRPVDVAEGPDGAIYVSDDYAGAIWRVAYGTVLASEARSAPALARPADPGLDALPPAERTALAERGATLFRALACVGCHPAVAGTKGVSLIPLAQLRTRWTVERLVEFFAAPTPPMPAVDRPAADRRALAVHVLTHYP